VAIIPARMGSSRFPGKPLIHILGLPMIEHVRRRVLLCPGLTEVVVATCDEEIRGVVEQYGGKVIMTSSAHERCTDRIEEAAKQLSCDLVVNVQGDEPALLPEVVSRVVGSLVSDARASSACITYRIADEAELGDRNIVKTVITPAGSVLYFSRSPIPSRLPAGGTYFKQSGIMAYRKDFLHTYAALPPTPLEAAESVDMLRILEHGYEIRAVLSEHETQGVDVPSDVAKIETLIRADPRQWSLYERIALQ
jgi:3-deoxy-manno-octulosonate cytidylyltransferase (CMP-KDO synthetase)